MKLESEVLPSPAYHEVRFAFDERRTGVWNVITGYLQRWVQQDYGVMDLGAGYGDFIRTVKTRSKWALDVNTKLVNHWGEGVTPVIQSALDPFPIESGQLGTVFASNFFEHFTSEEGSAILGEIRRVLRPGGRLIIIQPNFRLEPGRYFDDYTHKTIYTDNGFRDFLKSLDWKIVHSEPRFTPFTMKSRLPTWEWLIRLYLALPYRPFAGQFLVIAEKP